MAVWAFIWAHPFPHPDSWAVIAALQGRVSAVTLGIAGRISLGVTAALVYLVLRGFWILQCGWYLDDEEGIGFGRLAPVCGAMIFALSPFAWRAGQFLTPDFALVMLTVLGFAMWLYGRGGRRNLVCSLGCFVLGFVGAINLIGIVSILFVVIADAVQRWRSEQDHGQREDDMIATRMMSAAAQCSGVALIGGMVAGFLLIVLTMSNGAEITDFLDMIAIWKARWLAESARTITSASMVALAMFVLIAWAGMMIGRRAMRRGSSRRKMRRMLFMILAATALAMVLRSIDAPERARLAAMSEYAAMEKRGELESRFDEWTQHLISVADAKSANGPMLGEVDDRVERSFDAVLWRAARLAEARSKQRKNGLKASEREQALAVRMDGLNKSVQVHGENAVKEFKDILRRLPKE